MANVIEVTVRGKDDASDALKRTRRSVEEVEDSVKELEDAWKKAGDSASEASSKVAADTDEIADSTDGAGESMGAFGKIGAGAMVGVAAAVAGVTAAVGMFASKLSEAMDIEKGRDRLAAQLGLTAEQSEAFGRTAGELYSAAYGDGLEDVNEALRYVQQNIGDGVGVADDALKTVTASVMDLSDAFGEDLGPVSRAVGVMIKNGLVTDAGQALDILTIGLQNGANAGEDLLDTFSEYSPKFAEVGVAATTAMGMISQAMQAGARDSDFVADAIKEFAIRSKDGSKTSAEAFQAIGLDADRMFKIFAGGGEVAETAMADVLRRLRDMKDPVQQNAMAVALFGTKAEDLGRSLYAMDPTTAVSALGEVEGAASRLGNTLADNAGTKIESFKRSLQTGINDFMTNTVLPGIVSTVERIGEAFGPKLETARQNWDTFVAALQGEGTAPEWMQPIVDMVEKLRTKFEEFKPQLEDFYNNVLKKVEEVWPSIEAGLRSFYDNALVPFMEWVGENSEQLKNWAVLLGIVAAVITGVLVVAFAAMVGATAIAVAAIIGIGIVLNMIIQVIWDVFNNVRDAFGGVIDKIEELVQWFWDLAQNVGSAIADAVRWVNDLPEKIKSAVGDLGSLLVNAGRSLIEGLINGFNEKLQWAKDKVSDGLGAIRRLFPFSPAKEGPFSGSGYTDVSGARMVEDFAKGALSRTSVVTSAVSHVMQAVQSQFGMREAIAEALAHVQRGGTFGEDFSFEGQSRNFGDWNEKLADLFYAQNPGYDFRGNSGDYANWIRQQGQGAQLSVGPGADGAVATMIMQLVRSGQIQITPAGAM